MSSIGVNLRVTGHCCQGGRSYMEDTFAVAYQQTDDSKDLEYAYFGIFDGHGGAEAAQYAKEHLIDAIVSHNCFWSDNDEDVLRAIHDGYIQTHYSMYKQYETWPRTASGMPSTSGTTATVAFIRRGKLYIGHVGDSCVVLGYQEKGQQSWRARPLTTDHKPEAKMEITRINECGGKVVTKSGVPRIVWNRPRLGHKGPVRRSTHIDEIPFLAVARALGDFWSYNSASNKFVVSPEPDVSVHTIDVESFRCLILGTDGLWNMLSPSVAVDLVQATELHNEKPNEFSLSQSITEYADKEWINPSKVLVDKAIHLWARARQRADNTSVVTLLLDPPGPPKAQFMINNGQLICKGANDGNLTENNVDQSKYECTPFSQKPYPYVPNPSPSGIAIFTRYPSMARQSTSSLDSLEEHMAKSNNENKHYHSNSKIVKKSNNSSSFRRVSNSEPEISITNIESGTPSPCEKRKHTSLGLSHSIRIKQKIRMREKEEERNSDVENSEQWSKRWNDGPCSSSRVNIIKNKSKRRRCSFDHNVNWSCHSPLPATSLNKSPLHKSFHEGTTRILRSDTVANTTVKTLRSRNIDLTLTLTNPPTSSLMKPKFSDTDMKMRSFLHKSCSERPTSPKERCVRTTPFSSSSDTFCKKQSGTPKMTSSSFGPRVATTRSSSKRIVPK